MDLTDETPVETYGLLKTEVGKLKAVLAQYTPFEISVVEHTQTMPVNLHTAVEGYEVRAVLPVIIIKPVNNYKLAVQELSKHFPGTVVVCEMYQKPRTVLAIGVDRKLYPIKMIDILAD